MNLSESQKTVLASWLAQGESLGTIQSKLKSEFDLSMTFMELRFLIDDLDLEVKSPEPVENTEEPESDSSDLIASETDDSEDADDVSIEVDSIVTPGAIVSGSVRFSDGVRAQWQIDQLGRLGLSGAPADYHPPAEDIQLFQMKLQDELKRKGMV